MSFFKILLISFLFFFFIPFYGKSQQIDPNSFKITPVSPNTASLGLYGHTPVGHYTGIPSIEIPLYEIDLDGKKIPISISYHASGIRVAQEATSIGLGWSLNLGGCITKTVNGEDDFVSSNNAFKSFYFDNVNYPELKSDIYNKDILSFNNKYSQYFASGKAEPDMYFYNFAGFSGKMMFDRVGTTYKGFTNTLSTAKAMLLSPKKIIDIFYTITGGFVAKDLDGYTYGFEEIESSSGFSQQVSIPLDKSDNELRQLITSPQGTQTTAYYLTYIESPAKNRVTFQYEKEYLYSPVSLSEQLYHTPDMILTRYSSYTTFPATKVQLVRKYYDATYSYNRIMQLRPIGVTFNGGSISINAAPRQDLLAVPNEAAPKRITSLEVKDFKGNLVKSFVFNQSYRGTALSNESDYLYKRMVLDKIIENGEKTYAFSYNLNDLPPKNSFETDFWGYYNMGQIEGNPKTFETIPSTGVGGMMFYGRDKRPKSELLQNMMLSQIKYPTGGFSNFYYEPHRLDYTMSNLIQSLKPVYLSTAVVGQNNSDPCNLMGTTGKVIYSEEFETNDFVEGINLNFRVNNINSNNASCGSSITNFTLSAEIFDGTNYVDYTSAQMISAKYDFAVAHSQLNFEKNISNAFGGLKKGKFRLKLRVGTPGYVNFSVSAGIEYLSMSNATENIIAGAGLRIKKIENVENNKIERRNFSYTDPRMMYTPSFSKSLLIVPEFYFMVPIASLPQVGINEYFMSSTSTIVPFSNAAQGNIIGYSRVIESVGDNRDLGYDEYRFINLINRTVGNGAEEYIPYFPTFENFTNGSPLSVTKYNSNNQLVQKDTFNYRTNLIKNISAFKIFVPRPIAAVDGGFFGFYDLKVEESVLDNKTSTSYVNGVPAQVSREDYLYDPTYSLPISTERTDSQGKVRKQLVKYPFDYTDVISTGMVAKNLKGIPIETLSLVGDKVVSAQKTTYKDTLNMYLPSRFYTFNSSVPQPLSTYAQSYKSDYVFNLYNAKGKLLEFYGPDMSPNSYLWDNLNLYPLATIKNATYAQALSAFGTYDFSGTGNVNSIKENLIRNGLSSSLVTTYTYKPLVGMTSKTDARGITEYYKYDGMQRLQAILDHLNNVNRSFDYHYRSN